ncbi:MAG: hypothetical protein NWE84_05745 [Candidatus Bathyarchaeota archaeon]|nr:hypothetical protein [Candidatus Bathyarchaeota archaeon]
MNRKLISIFIIAILLTTSIALFVIFSTAHTTAPPVSTNQQKGLVFIENVLPIDCSQYYITFRPPLPGFTPVDDRFLVETYSLESKDSSLTFICSFYEGVSYQCNLYIDNGSLITDQPYANTTEAAKSFLEEYQALSKLDSKEMVAMLTNVDPIENMAVTSENLKLTVTHKDLTGTWFGDTIDFRWVRVINGCEYLVVYLSFRDGAFSGIIDHRQRYLIGDTSVNISKEQAIKIALEAVKNYSYRMSDDWIVSGFEVVEHQIIANLVPSTKEANILYPAWSVTLPLNGIYPGSVRELLVGIWAGTGEVYFVHHQAYATPT